MPHRGHKVISLPLFEVADTYVAYQLYLGISLPEQPLTFQTPSKSERNQHIRRRYKTGETVAKLAQVFDISEQRVSQIIRNK
ncbi:sigma factor-like helix-turn-helix DNA-binding protein [Chloroflexota bacterium]